MSTPPTRAARRSPSQRSEPAGSSTITTAPEAVNSRRVAADSRSWTLSTRLARAPRAALTRSSGHDRSGRGSTSAPGPTGRNPAGLNRRGFTGAASGMPDSAPNLTTGTPSLSATLVEASGATRITSTPSSFPLSCGAPGRWPAPPTRRIHAGTSIAVCCVRAARRASRRCLRRRFNLRRPRRATLPRPRTTHRATAEMSCSDRIEPNLRKTLPASTTTGGLSTGLKALACRTLPCRTLPFRPLAFRVDTALSRLDNFMALRPRASVPMVRDPNSSPAAAHGSSAPACMARRSARVRTIRTTRFGRSTTLLSGPAGRSGSSVSFGSLTSPHTRPKPSRPLSIEARSVGQSRTRGGTSRRTAACGTSVSRSSVSTTRGSDPNSRRIRTASRWSSGTEMPTARSW